MIECYYTACKFHSCHYDDIGPLCEEENCRASAEELEKYGESRRKEREQFSKSQLKRIEIQRKSNV